MMSQCYVDPDDLTSERKVCPVRGPYIQVLNDEFEAVCELPDNLSDAEVRQIIRLINNIYNKGYEWGLQTRSHEIALLLGIRGDALQ